MIQSRRQKKDENDTKYQHLFYTFRFVWKFMKSCRADVKTFYACQQDVLAYADTLIYCVRLQIDMGDRPAEIFFAWVATLFWKKLKDINFLSNGHCWEGALNFALFHSVNKVTFWCHNFLSKQAQNWSYYHFHKLVDSTAENH